MTVQFLGLAIIIGLMIYYFYFHGRVKLNRDLRWGGWVKIRRVIYATNREEFVVEAYDKYNREFYDQGTFKTMAEAEAKADAIYDGIIIREEPVVQS